MTDTQKEPGRRYWTVWYAVVLLVLVALIFLFSYMSAYYSYNA